MEGLRERKKARTRQAIARAALRLFAERGFERTRVDDIVAAAEVSRSTFFRYFDRKEDVVFVHHAERIAGFRRLLDDELVAGHHGVVAVRRALLRAVDAVVDEQCADPERLRLPRQLVAETPALAARASQTGLDWELAIADALRRGAGDDPGHRRRADLMAGVVAGPVRAAMRAWEDSDYSVDVRALAEEGLDLVERGLAATSTPVTRR